MRSVAVLLTILTACLWLGYEVIAQERPSPAADPRIGLKAGLKDAGVAARNMELVKSIPKPEGFFDPKSPLGTPTPAEPGSTPAPPPPPQPAPQATVQPASGIDFANSDIAFSRDYLFLGNFSGF